MDWLAAVQALSPTTQTIQPTPSPRSPSRSPTRASTRSPTRSTPIASPSRLPPPTTLSTNLPLSDCDLVIIVDGNEPGARSAIYAILRRLRVVGLGFRILPWVKLTRTLAIFVFCPPDVLARENYIQNIRDWLQEPLASCSDPPLMPTSLADAEMLCTEITAAERLRLIHSLVVMPTYAGGAGVTTLDALVRETDAVGGLCVKTILAPHNVEADGKWLRNWNHKWLVSESDIDDLQRLAGEKVAYYFAFLRFYFLALAPLAAVGIFCFFTSHDFSYFYTYFMLAWSVFFLVAWDYKVKLYAAKWGTITFRGTEDIHATFLPEKIISDEVTHERIPIYPHWKRWTYSCLVTLPLIIFFGCISVLLTFVVALSEVVFHRLYLGPFREYLFYVPTILYSAFIPQLNTVYSKLSRKLNVMENYQTQSSHDNALNFKLFAFSCIVLYLGLFGEAWLFTPLSDLIESAFTSTGFKFSNAFSGPDALRQRLTYLMVTGQITGVISEVVVPFVMGKYTEYTMQRRMDSTMKREGSIKEALGAAENIVGDGFRNIVRAASTVKRRNKTKKAQESEETFLTDENSRSGSSEGTLLQESNSSASIVSNKSIATPDALTIDDLSGELLTKVDKQFIQRLRVENEMEEYDIFEDYAEMALQFGYLVLFSSAWSLAPLACLINNFFEQRTDAFKICKTARRPIPARCVGIGSWREILMGLSWAGSITGASLVTLYKQWDSTMTPSVQSFSRFPTIVVAVILTEHLFFFLWMLATNMVSTFWTSFSSIFGDSPQDTSSELVLPSNKSKNELDDSSKFDLLEIDLKKPIACTADLSVKTVNRKSATKYASTPASARFSRTRRSRTSMINGQMGSISLAALQKEVRRTEVEHRAVFLREAGIDPNNCWSDVDVDESDSYLFAAKKVIREHVGPVTH